MTLADPRLAVTEAAVRDRLPAWLSARLGLGPTQLASMQRLSGGYSNWTWLLSFSSPDHRDSFDVVLRFVTDAGVSTPDDLPLATQYALLSVLERTAVPAPQVLGYEPDVHVLGGEFMVMRPVGGTTGPRFIPLDDPDKGAKLQSFVSSLAEIHRLDWEVLGLGNILHAPTAYDCAAVTLGKVMRAVSSRGVANHPTAKRAIAWLRERLPKRSEVALVHGDPNLSNYRFAGGQVVGVLDWEMAMLSDPVWDIAFYCGAIPKFYASLPPEVQQNERERFLHLYQTASGRSCDHLEFWEVLFTLRGASGSQLTAMGDNRTPIYWDRLDKLTR